MTFLEVSTEDQIKHVESLAREIWTEHYTPIIGSGQVDYMLDKFQSGQAIAAQIRTGALYFLMQDKGEYIGYLAVQQRGEVLFLSKIYVASSRRGEGYGRKAIEFIESLARTKGLRKIVLTVNKNNRESIAAYEKTGFKKMKELVQDIGSGFVMDDYQMEKTVEPQFIYHGDTETRRKPKADFTAKAQRTRGNLKHKTSWLSRSDQNLNIKTKSRVGLAQRRKDAEKDWIKNFCHEFTRINTNSF